MRTTPLRVLLTDRAWPDAEIEREILARTHVELIEAPVSDEATLCRLARDADGIMTNWAKVGTAVVAAAERCRIISRTGIGLDNIDVAMATARGIPVTNVPDYCVGEVADHTLALLLACARNIPFFHRRTKEGEYNLQAAPPMRRLAGQTLGLIGLGRIGRNLVPKARALGLEVVACTSSGSDHGTGCPILDRHELLGRSDFVSLHLPLSVATRKILTLPDFKRMKSSAFLINTSRGGLIDHDDLWTALQGGLIAGAALDVFDPEPPDLSLPLFRDERVVLTPHAAFVSQESLIELRTRTAHQVATALSGGRPECVVNPQVYDSPASGSAAARL
jgi:D-3-phosphoglycerate dehydrogenase